MSSVKLQGGALCFQPSLLFNTRFFFCYVCALTYINAHKKYEVFTQTLRKTQPEK